MPVAPRTSSTPGHAHQALAGLLALCTTALAILLAILLGIWWREPDYVMPYWVVLAGGTCAALTGIGGVLATRRAQTTSWLAPTVTLAALLGVLSAGTLVLLPVVVVSLLVAAHQEHRVPAIPQPTRRVSAGLVLTLGLVPLCLLVLPRGPVVDCTSNGVDEGSPIWMWLGSLGTGAASPRAGRPTHSYALDPSSPDWPSSESNSCSPTGNREACSAASRLGGGLVAGPIGA